jgi:hypothetical protein
MFKLYELAVHAEQRDNTTRLIVTGLRWRSDTNVDTVALIKDQYAIDYPMSFAIPPVAVKDGIMYDLYSSELAPVEKISDLTVCKWANNPLFEIEP